MTKTVVAAGLESKMSLLAAAFMSAGLWVRVPHTTEALPLVGTTSELVAANAAPATPCCT